jgi:hypothetical protein
MEVISSHAMYTEVKEKVFDWLETGTQMVIVVNPRQRVVTVYRSLTNIIVLTENDTLDGAEVMPGWAMVVKDILV